MIQRTITHYILNIKGNNSRELHFEFSKTLSKPYLNIEPGWGFTIVLTAETRKRFASYRQRPHLYLLINDMAFLLSWKKKLSFYGMYVFLFFFNRICTLNHWFALYKLSLVQPRLAYVRKAHCKALWGTSDNRNIFLSILNGWFLTVSSKILEKNYSRALLECICN